MKALLNKAKLSKWTPLVLTAAGSAYMLGMAIFAPGYADKHLNELILAGGIGLAAWFESIRVLRAHRKRHDEKY